MTIRERFEALQRKGMVEDADGEYYLDDGPTLDRDDVLALADALDAEQKASELFAFMAKTMNIREYNFWYVFKRADDVPGEWVGHCLDLDVVTQGTSLEHALSMLGEACFMTVCDDVQSGQDPLNRRAPQSCWDLMYNMVNHGRPVDFHTLDEKKVGFVACQVQFKCRFSRAEASIKPERTEVPLAWLEIPSAKAEPCHC
jgi:predicted RNase H-like HicB family nuclease